MRARPPSCMWVLGPLFALSACVLSEAQKIDGAAGGGGSVAGPTSTQTGPGTGGAGGAGGTGGMGGMPPTCTSAEPGSTEWVAPFGEMVAPAMGTADQLIKQLSLAPGGVLVLGQYTESMRALDKPFPPQDGGGNAFLAWLTPEGGYVLDGGDKVEVYPGDATAPPFPRGLAVLGERVAVVGAFEGAVTVDGATIPAPPNRQPLFILNDGSTAQATTYAEIAAGLDQLDDVALGASGQVIVSGFSTGGLTLPSGDLAPPAGGTVFLASLTTPTWALPVTTGYEAQDAMQVAVLPDGRIYAASSVKPGTYSFGSESVTVTSLSAVLVLELQTNGTVSQAVVFEGGAASGDQALVRDLVAGPDGQLAVVGAFFGDLVFDVGDAKVVSASPGQTDGFAAVLDPNDLRATQWRSFGTAANGETVWAASFDPCGSIVLLGTYRMPMLLDTQALSPSGPADFFVTKLHPEQNGSLTLEWAKSFGHAAHLECAAASDQNERNCYRLVATEEGVYVAGAYGGTISLGDGVDRTPVSGEDSFVMKLAP